MQNFDVTLTSPFGERMTFIARAHTPQTAASAGTRALIRSLVTDDVHIEARPTNSFDPNLTPDIVAGDEELEGAWLGATFGSIDLASPEHGIYDDLGDFDIDYVDALGDFICLGQLFTEV